MKTLPKSELFYYTIIIKKVLCVTGFRNHENVAVVTIQWEFLSVYIMLQSLDISVYNAKQFGNKPQTTTDPCSIEPLYAEQFEKKPQTTRDPCSIELLFKVIPGH